eukprot:TRINITY_DN2850_c0_g1_i4.p1 TRINITY_DN2850_c0_g1~~TRINITY_DN2850_c0_g1_i4.p1  ORF type:complete len:183 (+),score=29.29 TRINITY_DN2850_c0_g1_i4:93-641(+)
MALISHRHQILPSFPHSSFNFDSISKKKRPFSCTPSPIHYRIRSEVSFSVGTHLIPHPNKVDRGGEDAFFVSTYNGGVLAIADGVSGWAERDVNPALFPQELMTNASYLVGDEEVNYDPQILLRKAHAATSSVGSATVLIGARTFIEEYNICLWSLKRFKRSIPKKKPCQTKSLLCWRRTGY